MTRRLLETSTLILLGELDPALLPDEPLICTITLAELSMGPLVAPDASERAARQAHLQQGQERLRAGRVRRRRRANLRPVAASLRRRGRKPAARASDALIAAVAISRALPVVTRNADDFVGIDDLVVVPVALPQR